MLAMLLGLTPCAAVAETWTAVVSPTVAAAVTPALTELAAAVARTTSGNLTITPTPAGNAERASTAVRSGKAPLAIIRVADEAPRSAVYAIDLIPGLLTPGHPADPRPAHLAAAARSLIARRVAEDGLVLLAYAPVATDVLVLPRPLPAIQARTGQRIAAPPRPDAALTRLAELLALTRQPGPDPIAQLQDPATAAAIAPASALSSASRTAAHAVIAIRTTHVVLLAGQTAFAALPEPQRAALRAASANAEATLASAAPAPPDAAAPAWLETARRQLMREWATAVGADAGLLMEHDQQAP